MKRKCQNEATLDFWDSERRTGQNDRSMLIEEIPINGNHQL